MGAHTIQEKLKLIKDAARRVMQTVVVIPAIFVMVTVVVNLGLERKLNPAMSVAAATIPNTEIGVIVNGYDDAAVVANIGPEDTLALLDDASTGSIIIDDAAILNTGNPERGVLTERDGALIYKVQSGETLSSIAAKFGVSLNTVYWANKGIEGRALRIGQEITVLPISGIFHQMQPEETVESIAALYEVSEAKILKYNKKIGSHGFAVGENIIIPDARPINGITKTTPTRLPDYPGYYALPTTGWNWGKLHNNNAVDIANACGTPIYASAEGLVTEVASPVNWNEGYGGYVMIEHPNGTKTRYAHTQRNVASVGQYVLQGDTVGYIGNTGLTHGPTGCHVHFEVVGARNPFAK